MAADQFVQLLVDCQPRLYAYVRTLIPDAEHARDVLQETNVILWKKRDEFTLGSNFNAWARKIATYQAMAWRRNSGRDRHFFSDSLFEQIAAAADRRSEKSERIARALRVCMKKLSDVQQTLLRRRYFDQTPVSQLADEEKRTPNSVSISLFRVRSRLLECIQGILSTEDQE